MGRWRWVVGVGALCLRRVEAVAVAVERWGRSPSAVVVAAVEVVRRTVAVAVVL